ncbi:MAG TPA: carbohydrate ABC transporter permease [Ktedonobacteraceae bacterium]|jgi:alpha-glucoside transport system permease protein
MSVVDPKAGTNTGLSIHSKPASAQGKNSQAAQSRSAGRPLLGGLSGGILTVIVVCIGLVWSVPTIGLFVSSFRPEALINTTGWWTAFAPPWSFTFDNYQQVLQAQGMGQSFLNSIIIAIPATILPVLIGAISAYALAWMDFPGRNWLFFIIIALPIIPAQATLIPILTIFTATGLTGTYAALWIAHTAAGLPFAIYMLRNFFSALPKDLIESAEIDGASHARTFFSLILPLSVPALASLAIFQFMWVWNDLLLALIFLGGSPNSAPMTVTVANLVNSFGSNYQVLTAAAFVSMILPLVVFFSLQRYFVRGILAGSVKG